MRLVYTVSSVLLLVFLALPVGVSAQGETPTPTETPFVLVTATPVPTPPTPTPDAVVLLREISARDSQVASMQLFGIAGGLGLLAFTLAVLMVGARR